MWVAEMQREESVNLVAQLGIWQGPSTNSQVLRCIFRWV